MSDEPEKVQTVQARRYTELQGLIEAVEERLLQSRGALTPHEAQLVREQLKAYGRALLREELNLERTQEIHRELLKLKEELRQAMAMLQEAHYAEGWHDALLAVASELDGELPTVPFVNPYATEDAISDTTAAEDRSEREVILAFLEKHAIQQEVSVAIAYAEDEHLRLHKSDSGMAQTAAGAVITALKKQAEEL